jgi:outer membrane protein TolC
MSKMGAILFSAVVFSWGGDALTLEGALRSLESGNHSLEASRAKIESAEHNRKASFGSFLPVVKLEVSAQYLDRDLVLNLDGIRESLLQMQSLDAATQQNLLGLIQGSAPLDANQSQAIANGAYQKYNQAIPHFIDTVKTQYHWLSNVSVYQPLFHGGRILAGYQVSQAKEAVARADNAKQLGDLRRDFSKYYLQGALLHSSIALRTNALGAIAKHRDRARSLVEHGMADRTALLRAELALAEGQTALAEDSMKLASISITLGQMLGNQNPIDIADLLSSPPTELPESGPLASNPLVNSIEAQGKVVEGAAQAKRADFVPEIGAFGKLELNQSALSSLEPNWIVGVKGTMTLFRGGGDYHGLAAIKANQREVSAIKAEAIEALQAQGKRQGLAFVQAKLRYENQGRQVDLAEESHRVCALRFGEGQATGLEVVDAWLALQKVQLERLSSAYEAWVSLLEMSWVSGSTENFAMIWKEAQK